MNKIKFLLLSMFFASAIFAQEVKTICEIPFDEEFKYFISNDPIEPIPVGINSLCWVDGKLFFANAMNKDIYCLNKNNKPELLWKLDNVYFSGKGPFLFFNTSSGYVYGYFGIDYQVYLRKNNSGSIEEIKFNIKELYKEYDHFSLSNYYYLDDYLFIEFDNKKLVCIDMHDFSHPVVKNYDETNKWLESGIGKKYGWRIEKDSMGFSIGSFFGNHAVNSTNNGLMYYKYKDKAMDMSKSVYKNRNNLARTGYVLFGYDDKGLNYFIDKYSYFESGKSEFLICVYDTWTNTPYFYENYDNGQWNPPVGENGYPVPSLDFAVSNNGDVYYSDCNYDEKKYLIKKVVNKWYDDIGIQKRHIGYVNSSCIPVFKKASSSGVPVSYCYLNDLVWETKTSATWSKVQFLDGTSGWIESKYIDF